MPVPLEIRLNRSERKLEVSFDNGTQFSYPAEYLRVESPSAEVQGHGQRRVVLGGKRDVGITTIEPVGNYAIRIVFNDGHDTGIFSWDVLETLAREREARWQTYLNELSARGLSR